jgi:hypothetical protein
MMVWLVTKICFIVKTQSVVKCYMWSQPWAEFCWGNLISMSGYSSPDIVRTVKLRRMRWVRHVGYMGKLRNMYKIWLYNLKGGNHLENVVVYVRIILTWTSGSNRVGECGLDASV